MGGCRRPVRRGRDRVGAVQAVQLARRTGAAVIGLASESNREWLKSHGVIPVAYGDGVADRIRAAAPGGVDAFIGTYGDGYVELALALGAAPSGSTPSSISRPPRSTG
jgi:NADPH:quinone reductase-like Zn-dependent oxidoreductase